MPRNINDVYNLYRYIVRKERSVFVTIPQFNQNMDAGQLDAFELYFKPYGTDETIHDALRPFRVYHQFTSDAAGIVTFPSDYQHLVGTPFSVMGSTVNEITFINEDEFVNALHSQLRPVSLLSPIALDTSNGFRMWPSQLQIGFFTYLRRPATPLLSVTQVDRTITYNPLTSVQLEWLEVYWNNIIARALKYAGVNMDEQGVSAFADQYEKETE